MSLMNKRNVRIYSITGLLLFIVFLFVQNDNSLLGDSVFGGGSPSAPPRTAQRGMNNIDNVNDNVISDDKDYKDESKKSSWRNLPKLVSEENVNAQNVHKEIDKIKEQVGIPLDNGITTSNSDKGNHDKFYNSNANKVSSNTVQNNPVQRGVPGGSEDAKFNPAQEYANILETAPVVLLSKTFCPYCKKLKALLEKEYSFTPKFAIVELDKHPNGDELFAYIKQQTGHPTVPNLLAKGKTLGGFDSIKKLHDASTLIDTIQKTTDYGVIVEINKKPSNV